MCYQLLTGHLPHKGNNVVEVLMKQMTAEPKPPSEVGPHVPQAMDAPVLAMMAKEASQRPSSCTLAIQALTDAALEAGFDIPSASHSGEQDARLVRSGPGAHKPPTVTPAEGSEALAATLASGSGSDLSAPAPAKARTRAPLVIGMAVMVAAVAAVPFLLDATSTPPPPPEEPSAPVQASATMELPPEAMPEAPAPTVLLAVAGAPEGATILGPGGVQLGVAPGVLELPQSSDPLQLTFRKEGFEDLEREIVPVASGTITVDMKRSKPVRRPPQKRRSTKKKKDKGKDDLEIPDWD